MFNVGFFNSFGTPGYTLLTDYGELVGMAGFEFPTYTTSTPESDGLSIPASFRFRPSPFSISLLVTDQNAIDYNLKIVNILQALRQYKNKTGDNRIVIFNGASNFRYDIPVIIDTVEVTPRTGHSSVITIRGQKLIQGVIANDFSTLFAQTNTNPLPKTITFSYPFSFPSPIRIILTGPISAGFSISRIDNLPLYDFTLTVGTAIPLGVSVVVDYSFRGVLSGNAIINAKYLQNPEVCPDIVMRPQPVNGSYINTFNLTGTSSSGTVRFEVYPQKWSIYE